VMTPCLLVLGERLKRSSPDAETRKIETG